MTISMTLYDKYSDTVKCTYNEVLVAKQNTEYNEHAAAILDQHHCLLIHSIYYVVSYPCMWCLTTEFCPQSLIPLSVHLLHMLTQHRL